MIEGDNLEVLKLLQILSLYSEVTRITGQRSGTFDRSVVTASTT
jgi:hypothetical protein